MNTETIIVFSLGMVFYRGVVGETHEIAFRIASILSLVIIYHKVVCNMHI
ncbi:hypothetical protein NEOKW01_0332 [Nematocida sp. AWRm80]|nr:hypothetical protein NEOKW01_0332 [Nematocida sp. AWRm80]